MRRLCVLAALAVTLMSCAKGTEYTMYRNSPFDVEMRVHWASFDAGERDPYNATDCALAAHLLNANLKAINGAEYNPAIGYWCEAGAYTSKGAVPSRFNSAFPDRTGFGPS